jgi:hypothetical protein
MPDADNAFAQATDNLISLYRSIERSTLDLPLVSFMPVLIVFWSILKFYFFFVVGLFLIIPANLVILIRNLFLGHWRYRPFFLHHLYYMWLWIWRGEAPTAPAIFIRPLLSIFINGHFEYRLRRLRLEILLRDGLSDATRSALLARLDAALERWKSPRFPAIFFTVLLPGIFSFPSWYKQLIELLGSLGMHMPTEIVVGFVSQHMSNFGLQLLALFGFGYLLAIPVTAFLAKRGLFIGREPDRICFPGGQEGSGAYFKEKEILGSVGLHAREAPIDLWLLAFATLLGVVGLLLMWDDYIAWMQMQYHNLGLGLDLEQLRSQFAIQTTLVYAVLSGLILVAALRRRKTERA